MTTSRDTLRAVKAFDFYVRHVWPLHRLFVRRRIARRCRQCAASEKMLELDATLLCRACREMPLSDSHEPLTRNTDGVRELDEILRHHQGRGSAQYDALVLFSGGKDSTYLIRKIGLEYPGLRLLAMTMDNSFMSSVAKKNIDDILPKLHVDHIFVRPRRSFYIKLFRYCITHLNAIGGYGTVDFSDGEFMLDTARNIAAEKKIPLILCGYSRYQGQDRFESPRSRELSDRIETAGIPLREIFSPEEIAQWWHGSRWPPEQVARLLFPIYAWNLEETEIERQVKAWGLGKEQNPIVTNHQLIPLLGVIDVHQRGYSSFEIGYCPMIRAGKADRQKWQHTFEFLEHCSKTGLFLKKPVLESLSQLNLTTDDVGIRFER